MKISPLLKNTRGKKKKSEKSEEGDRSVTQKLPARKQSTKLESSNTGESKKESVRMHKLLRFSCEKGVMNRYTATSTPVLDCRK